MDGGAWWAAVHGVAKSRTQLSDFTFTFHFHALEKEMATHSSVLAWRIPGTVEPGGLPSMGSQSRTQLKRLSSSSITSPAIVTATFLLILDSGPLVLFSYAVKDPRCKVEEKQCWMETTLSFQCFTLDVVQSLSHVQLFATP